MKRLIQLVCCAALVGCAAEDGPVVEKSPTPSPEVTPETPQSPGETPVERPADVNRPAPHGVEVGHGMPDRAELTPEPTIDPDSRPRRRLNVDQLSAAVFQVSGGIGWTEQRGDNLIDVFEELERTLGKPDYIQNTEEDLEPTILFQKFLGDAARSTCSKMLDRDLETVAVEMEYAQRRFDELPEGLADKTLLLEVTPEDSIDNNPEAIDANLRALLMRFHGKMIREEDDVALANWRWLLRSSRHVSEPSDAWLAVCVAMFSHPDFYTY